MRIGGSPFPGGSDSPTNSYRYSPSLPFSQKEDQWADIVQYQRIKFEQEQKKTQADMIAKKLKMRDELNKQLTERRARDLKMREADKLQHEQMRIEDHRLNEVEKQVEKSRRKMSRLKEQKQLDEQLAEFKRMKQEQITKR